MTSVADTALTSGKNLIFGGSCHKHHFCCDKHTFVATNTCLSWQNTFFVVTKVCKTFVVTKLFVVTNICFAATKNTCGSSCQWQNLACSHYPWNKLKQAVGWTAIAQLWHSMVSSREVLLIISNASIILKLRSAERFKRKPFISSFYSHLVCTLE